MGHEPHTGLLWHQERILLRLPKIVPLAQMLVAYEFSKDWHFVSFDSS